MGIGGPKEGFSVFGLLSGGCATPMGRRMLRLWFLRPIINLEVLLCPPQPLCFFCFFASLRPYKRGFDCS